MSDERDETRSFSPFDDATWADDAARPGRGRSDDRARRTSRTPDDRARPQPADDATRPETPDDGTRVAQPDDGTRVAQPDDGTRVAQPDDVTRGDMPDEARRLGRPDDATLKGQPDDAPRRGMPDDATRLDLDDDAARAGSRTQNDRARPRPRADDPTVIGGPIGRRPDDATSVMPPAAANPAWSGRAEVRAPQPGQSTYYQEDVDWPAGPGPQEPRDRWWMPILVGIIVLVLLAALGWGIYLIFQNAGKSDNSPAPAVTASAPPAPSAAATTQTTEPSSAPTTTSPTPTPSTTDPTDDAVAIPALRGLTVADAKAALKQDGFTSTHVIYRPSSAQQDTVIDSDPEEGQEVPPDTTVTLVVAAPSTTTPTATATATGN
jgi:hypothetical protein